jgi:hypothetical protein
MNRRVTLIISATLAVIAVIILIISAVNNSTKQSLTLSQPVAANIRSAGLTSAGKLGYFDGSRFMEFSVAGQTSRVLTSSYKLPNITAVLWSASGVIFKAAGYSDSDQLTPILTSNNLTTDAIYWWSIDFKTGSINLVGTPEGSNYLVTTVSDPIWATDGKTYYFTQTHTFEDADPIITLYSAKLGEQPKAIRQLDAAALLWSDTSRLIYQSTNQIKEFNFKTGQIQVKSSSFQGVAFIDPGGNQSLLVPQTTNSTYDAFQEIIGPLRLQNLSTGSSQEFTKSFTGSVAWQSSGGGWVALNNPIENSFVSDGSKTKALVINLGKNKTLPGDPQVVGYDNNYIYLIDTSGTLYILGQKLPALKAAFVLDASKITFSLDDLLTYGVTSSQIEDLKYALRQYAAKQGQQVGSISISGINVAPRDRGAVSDTALFNISFDGKSIGSGKMVYSDLTNMELFISDATGRQVFDSGLITPQNRN